MVSALLSGDVYQQNQLRLIFIPLLLRAQMNATHSVGAFSQLCGFPDLTPARNKFRLKFVIFKN